MTGLEPATSGLTGQRTTVCATSPGEPLLYTRLQNFTAHFEKSTRSVKNVSSAIMGSTPSF